MALHWGHGGLREGGLAGGTPVHAGARTFFHANSTSAPTVRAPFYGYLLFQAAASPHAAEAARLGPTLAAPGRPGRLARITAAAATPACAKGAVKVWPVHHDVPPGGRTNASSELRVVLLNKSDRQDCRVTLRLNDAFSGAARLTRVAPRDAAGAARLASKLVRFGGAAFTDLSGRLSSAAAADEVLAPEPHNVGALSARPASAYSLHLPAASAALLVVTG